MKKIKKSPVKKAKKRTTLKDDIAKILSDLGKLTFGTMVLGAIIRSGLPQETQLTAGGIVAIVLFVISLILGAREIKLEEPPSIRGGKILRPPTLKSRRRKRSKR
jgi:hypothetical protein